MQCITDPAYLFRSATWSVAQLEVRFDRKTLIAAAPTTIRGFLQIRASFLRDASGLISMNARYYDPQLGQFISPDTLVPDGTNVFDYNRYMFVRGNPLRFHDPTGHATSKPD